MIHRHLTTKLLQVTSQYPVVSLTGPRQSGKTTLVRNVFDKYGYISLESPDHRDFAKNDPRGFLSQFSGPVILDEVQRAPDLFSYIQGIVDDENIPGRFILTGSHNFLLMEKISQTLAGRCAILHLLPLSGAELAARDPMPISNIGSPPTSHESRRDDLFEMLFRGFYPRIFDKGLDSQEWLRNYCQTYLERDLREMINVGDIETFSRFLRLCAGRSGQLLNLASLAADAGISHTSARRWLSILEASFIVMLLRPHHRNFNKRLVKTPKLYFLDSGLLCNLLRIQTSDDLRFHALRGAVFETWVISEVLKNYYNRGLEPQVFFWRDSAGHEVDLIVDRSDELVPVEIKSGETVVEDFFKTLEYWRNLPGQSKVPAALVYAGDSSFVRKNTAVYSWQDWG
jgi:predicted AAA+ superfamily ATPase